MALIALTATAGGCTSPMLHLKTQLFSPQRPNVTYLTASFIVTAARGCIWNCKFFSQLSAKLLHIALTVYGNSGGMVAPENTIFLATAARGRIWNCKFFSQLRPNVTPVTASFNATAG